MTPNKTKRNEEMKFSLFCFLDSVSTVQNKSDLVLEDMEQDEVKKGDKEENEEPQNKDNLQSLTKKVSLNLPLIRVQKYYSHSTALPQYYSHCTAVLQYHRRSHQNTENAYHGGTDDQTIRPYDLDPRRVCRRSLVRIMVGLVEL